MLWLPVTSWGTVVQQQAEQAACCITNSWVPHVLRAPDPAARLCTLSLQAPARLRRARHAAASGPDAGPGGLSGSGGLTSSSGTSKQHS